MYERYERREEGVKCRKCGSELDSDSVFCPECGTRVERPVENNSGDIVRDNVNSGTTADIPKQTKRGNTLLKIVIAILIVIILKSVTSLDKGTQPFVVCDG